MQQQRIVTRDEWIAARKELLIKEKALTRAHDALAAERRQLPMVKVDTSYMFDTPAGRARWPSSSTAAASSMSITS